MEWYRQCTLEKPLPTGGKQIQVSWIPEQFAKLNKYLKLLENNVWENGWQVVLVGGRQDREQRLERSRDYKKQRGGSDILRGTRGIGEKPKSA